MVSVQRHRRLHPHCCLHKSITRERPGFIEEETAAGSTGGQGLREIHEDIDLYASNDVLAAGGETETKHGLCPIRARKCPRARRDKAYNGRCQLCFQVMI